MGEMKGEFECNEQDRVMGPVFLCSFTMPRHAEYRKRQSFRFVFLHIFCIITNHNLFCFLP
jgi:hypothetical protein